MPTELDNHPTANVEFLQYHKPALADGKYEITVTQEIKIHGQPVEPFSTTRTFFVSGERFELKPTDIHAVFPPSGSLGEHANVLPHIILNRSTLPWERSADTSNDNFPWLALLLFEDGEKLSGTIDKPVFLQELKKYSDINGEAVWNHLLDKSIVWLKARANKLTEAIILPQDKRASNTLGNDFAKWESTIEAIFNQFRIPKIIPLSDLTNPSTDILKWPGIQLEIGQDKNDKVTIIDLEKSLLEEILPTKEDLAYLAHVRQGKDTNGKLVGDELAVIIGNRLPKKGGISTVHLVSVEGHYNSDCFDYQGARDNDLIRLVSLKSWSFACVDQKQSFKGLLTHLNRNPSTLRLPPNNSPEAEKYLASGYIPLPHYLRQGDKTISWYHSPLIPGENPTDITLPVRAADELVRYNPANGMFDISYAAAWELGRLLALQSKDFSINLYNWKRTHVQQLKQAEQKLIHLPTFNQPAEDIVEILGAIASWFKDLSLLEGIPFNYLVPDERMLPIESIRFFWVDSQWIECLLDGAFSIGRVTDSDHERDSQHEQSPAANPHEKVSGFLLRSAVVAGWPGLLVDGYSKVIDTNDRVSSADRLKLLRMERLSANILICLFNGEIKTVDIHQKPETLHFGLDSDDGNTSFYKKLRDIQANENGRKIDSIPWSHEKKRVINITHMAKKIQWQSTSAQFALEMIEGVERVRLKKLSQVKQESEN